jgi:stage V sporulation protein B
LDKALEMGKTTSTGSFHLFLGKTTSTVVMAVGIIIMGAIILDADYGLYTIAMIPATTMLLFQDWGVGSAVARECAQCRASNNVKNLRKVLLSSLTFEFTTAIILTMFSLVTAGFMATIFGNPDATFMVAFASISVLSTSIFAIAQSILVGFEKMKFISFVLIFQGLVQCILGPALVYLGFGAFGALIGYTVASVVAGVLAIVIVYFGIYRKLEKVKVSFSDLTESLRTLLKFGVPLALASIITGLLLQYNSFMMAHYVTDLANIGNYKVAINFTMLLTFFSVPITTVLFPAFSKLNPAGESNLTKSVFKSSVKYSTLLIVPATMALIVLSNPLIGALYGSKWPLASSYLVLSILFNLFVLFGNLSVPIFLTALGHTKFLLVLNLVGLAIGVPLALVLIPTMGITGMLICSFISGVPSLFISLYFLRKKYGVKIDLKVSSRILLSSTIAALAVYGFTTIFPLGNYLNLIVGIFIFLTLFLVCTPLVGAINSADIQLLRVMFNDLGIVTKFIEIPLKFMEKVSIHIYDKQ